MDEREWVACREPKKMLECLRNSGQLSERKAHLFAAASFRRLAGLLPDPRQRRGIEALEQWAEGDLPAAARRGVTTEVRQAIPPDDWVAGMPPTDHPHFLALMLYREFCCSSAARHALHATAGLADSARGQREQVRLIHCIFGNPFCPVTLPLSIRAWNDGILVQLATAIYEERAMPEGHLDNARLAVLVDVLEEAGCTDPDILGHLRQQGAVHVRGCFVLDLLLGKS